MHKIMINSSNPAVGSVIESTSESTSTTAGPAPAVMGTVVANNLVSPTNTSSDIKIRNEISVAPTATCNVATQNPKDADLIQAAAGGDEAQVVRLLKEGAKPSLLVDLSSYGGKVTAFIVAAKYGHLGTLRIFFSVIDQRIADLIAAKQLREVEILKKFASDMKTQSLACAIKYGYPAIVQYLKKAGADCDATIDGFQPFVIAVFMFKLTHPDRLKDSRSHLDTRSTDTMRKAYEKIFLMLLVGKHKITISPEQSKILWPYLFQVGTQLMFDALLAAGIEPGFESKEEKDNIIRLEVREDSEADLLEFSLFKFLVQNDENITVLQHCMSLGIDFNSIEDEEGNKLLGFACLAGSSFIVRWLLENGAISQVNSLFENTTLLSVAALAGHSEIVETLLDNGADPDAVSDGCTALINVLRAQDIDLETRTTLVELLAPVSRKVINVADENGDRALTIAAGFGDPEIISILLKNGASPRKRDGQGRTALMNAVAAHEIEAVELLIPVSPIDTIDCDGNTVFTLEADFFDSIKRKAIFEILLKYKIEKKIDRLGEDCDREWMLESFLPLLMSNLMKLDIFYDSNDSFLLQTNAFQKGVLSRKILDTFSDLTMSDANLFQIIEDFSTIRSEDDKAETRLGTKVNIAAFEIRLQTVFWLRSEQGEMQQKEKILIEARGLENQFINIRKVMDQLLTDANSKHYTLTVLKAEALDCLKIIHDQTITKQTRLNKKNRPRASAVEASTIFEDKERRELETLDLNGIQIKLAGLRENFEKYYKLNHEKIACLLSEILDEELGDELSLISTSNALKKLMKELLNFAREAKRLIGRLQDDNKKTTEKNSLYEARINNNAKKVQKAYREAAAHTKENAQAELLKKLKEENEKQRKMELEREAALETQFAKEREIALKEYRVLRAKEKKEKAELIKKEQEKYDAERKALADFDRKNEIEDEITLNGKAFGVTQRQSMAKPLTLERATQMTPKVIMNEKRVVIKQIFEWYDQRENRTVTQSTASAATSPAAAVTSIATLRVIRNAILSILAQMMETIVNRKGGHWFPVKLAAPVRDFIYHAFDDNNLLSLTKDNLSKIKKMAVELDEYITDARSEISHLKNEQEKIVAIKGRISSKLFHEILAAAQSQHDKSSAGDNATSQANITDVKTGAELLDQKSQSEAIRKPLSAAECITQIQFCEKEYSDYRACQKEALGIPPYIFRAAQDFTDGRRGVFEADFMRLYPKDYGAYVKNTGGWKKHRDHRELGIASRHNKMGRPLHSRSLLCTQSLRRPLECRKIDSSENNDPQAKQMVTQFTLSKKLTILNLRKSASDLTSNNTLLPIASATAAATAPTAATNTAAASTAAIDTVAATMASTAAPAGKKQSIPKGKGYGESSQIFSRPKK